MSAELLREGPFTAYYSTHWPQAARIRGIGETFLFEARMIHRPPARCCLHSTAFRACGAPFTSRFLLAFFWHWPEPRLATSVLARVQRVWHDIGVGQPFDHTGRLARLCGPATVRDALARAFHRLCRWKRRCPDPLCRSRIRHLGDPCDRRSDGGPQTPPSSTLMLREHHMDREALATCFSSFRIRFGRTRGLHS